jgi:PRC-barrel domain
VFHGFRRDEAVARLNHPVGDLLEVVLSVVFRLPLTAEEWRAWPPEIEVDVTIPDPEAVLTGSEGFLVDHVDGAEVGVVEEVETAPDGTVVALVVVAGWFGRRRARIPVDAIEAITLADRRIIVRG